MQSSRKDDGFMYDQITLPNGLRIIGECIPHYRSVSVGLWIGTGSQYEMSFEEGLSHFIEHMVFKGTEKRSARQIAEEMDAVGGYLNAFTSKECTCFYAKVLDSHLPLALDILSDMVTAPSFDPDEMKKEKGVVIEEIAMAEDAPEDLVHELLMQAHYGKQPLSAPILGSEQGIRACTPGQLRAYWQKCYSPKNTVLAIAGKYDWHKVIDLAMETLGGWTSPDYHRPDYRTLSSSFERCVKEKDIEQMHLCLGFPGLKIGDVHGYAHALFSNVYGGAMSSRLFQKIREEAGAAYTVYSSPNSYTDTGMLSVYAATNPDVLKAVYEMILDETRKLIEQGITEREFHMSREQLKAGYVMGLESTSSRMQAIGRRLLLLNETKTQSEILEAIDAIQLDDINQLIRRLMNGPHSIALVGRNCDAL